MREELWQSINKICIHTIYNNTIVKVKVSNFNLDILFCIITTISLTSDYVVERMLLTFFVYMTAYHKSSVSTFFEMAKAYHT